MPHVKADFWAEYAQAAGVYQIGEVLNGGVDYVANYQRRGLDATMNYPLYFTLKDVFNYRQSFYKIRQVFMQEKNAFTDM